MDFPENFGPISRAQYIEERTCRLLNTEAYDPVTPDNFAEAILKACNSEEEMETLRDYSDQRKFEQLGRMVWVWSFDNCEAKAAQKAAEEYDSGNIDTNMLYMF